MEDNNIRLEDLELFIKNISINIKKLNFARCNLKLLGVKLGHQLTNASKFKHLVELDLDNNDLHDEGVKPILTALK